MNIVFLSPHFPPNYQIFCQRLKAAGAVVLGLSDQPYETLRPELRAALSDYYQVSDMHRYEELVRGLGYFTYRHGKIDRIDSLNEYWLASEAHLRTDFNIPGIRAAELPPIKRKSAMKQRFVEAGVAVARGTVADEAAAVRAFAAEVGYPLVAKPDSGVGASETFKLSGPDDLERFLGIGKSDYFIEQYVRGTIVTFDGLADRAGEPVFFTSMEYSRGVMEVVNEDDDVYYYTVREVAPDLEAAGRAILRAYDVRERFFHFEFFRTEEGGLVALEVNMRPPGGWSLDMFNYANNIDLYGGWAELLVRGRFSQPWDAPYFVCYAGRKYGKNYAHSHERVLERYGELVVSHQPMPAIFSRAMGDYGYLIRSPELAPVVEASRFIQQKGG